jgi:hypothetical protein
LHTGFLWECNGSGTVVLTKYCLKIHGGDRRIKEHSFLFVLMKWKTKWFKDLFNWDIHINLGGFLMLYWNNNIDVKCSAQDTFIWYAQSQNIWKPNNFKVFGRKKTQKSLKYLSLSKYQDRGIVRYYSIIIYSYSDVWWGIAPEPSTRALYFTRKHYRKTVLEGEDNNMLYITSYSRNKRKIL